MKKPKIRVGILFGGRSAEHEVSLQSAKNIVQAIDKRKYDTLLIAIDKQGRWALPVSPKLLLDTPNPRAISLDQSATKLPAKRGSRASALKKFQDYGSLGKVDVVFPVLHGPYGEDGTIQGLLKLANIPYVGPDVLGSALGMDKDVQKRLLREAGIPVAKFAVLRRHDQIQKRMDEIIKRLGLPLFVKPANLGSSVGVSKIKRRAELRRKVMEAFRFDNKILVEEYIEGREIECSVLGNENPIASLPGEVIPRHEFYSYEAKYLDENGATLEIPAKLTSAQTKAVRNLAIKTFSALCCEGMARVDFFLTKKGKFVVNEINTIPGFTNISMYPKLWEKSGISQTELIDRLIHLAMERFKRDAKLKTTYE